MCFASVLGITSYFVVYNIISSDVYDVRVPRNYCRLDVVNQR